MNKFQILLLFLCVTFLVTSCSSSPQQESDYQRYLDQESDTWPGSSPISFYRQGQGVVGVPGNVIYISRRSEWASLERALRQSNEENRELLINHRRAEMMRHKNWFFAQTRTEFSRPMNSDQPMLTVFISPNCHLCEQWQRDWPSSIPVRWVPVLSSTDILLSTVSSHQWLERWCQKGDREEQAWLIHRQDCQSQLLSNYQQQFQLGLAYQPSLVSDNGSILTAWPDQDWLVAWWSPNVIPLASQQPAPPDVLF